MLAGMRSSRWSGLPGRTILIAKPTSQTTKSEKPQSGRKRPLNDSGRHSIGRVATGRKAGTSSPKLSLKVGLSAVLRDQLLAQVNDIDSPDELAMWAHRNLSAKNSLIPADAQQVENAFQSKPAKLTTATENDGSLPSLSIPSFQQQSPQRYPFAMVSTRVDWHIQIGAGADQIVPRRRTGQAAIAVDAGQRRVRDQCDSPVRGDGELGRQAEKLLDLCSVDLAARIDVGRRGNSDHLRLEVAGGLKEAPEQSCGFDLAGAMGGGKYGVLACQGHHVKAALDRIGEGGAVVVEDVRQTAVQLCGLVLRVDEHCRTGLRQGAQPVSRQRVSGTEMKQHDALARRALAGQRGLAQGLRTSLGYALFTIKGSVSNLPGLELRPRAAPRPHC